MISPIRVRVADGEAEGLDTSAGRWQVVCETHGSLVPVDSRAVARADARAARRANSCSEWCDDCRDVEEEQTEPGPGYREVGDY